MSKNVKLPDNINNWNINSIVSNDDEVKIYNVRKKNPDGSETNADMLHICACNGNYNEENVAFLNDEADFINNLKSFGDCFTYIDALTVDNEQKDKIDLFIITEHLTPLSEIMKSKQFDDNEIIDFGIQMSSILETLESNNIFHGNISPKSIFVTENGQYKLGGFTDFEENTKDASFIPPEKLDNADFTTDIYCLGLVMYCMSNANKLPFENDSVNKSEAIQKRLDGANIPAPENGADKLKSIIIIACQAKNSNRWKNAGNIKNALLSVQGEMPATAKTAPLPLETKSESNNSTDNSFEEYDFSVTEPISEDNFVVVEDKPEDVSDTISDDTDDTSENISNVENQSAEDETVNEIAENENFALDSADDNAESEKDSKDTSAEIKTDIYEDIVSHSDNYLSEEKEKKKSNSYENINFDIEDNSTFEETVAKKDYGDFFDDDDENKVEVITNKTNNKSTDKDAEKTPEHTYADEFTSSTEAPDEIENEEQIKKSKKSNTAIFVICIIAIVAALGFMAYCIFNGLNNAENNSETTITTTVSSETTKEPSNQNSSTQPTEETQSTTQAETISESTTAEPTTSSDEVTVTQVVGYGFSYGKKLLTAQGFIVEVGEYKYSDEYDEGYIIAQSPNGNTTAKTGTVIKLDISLGSEGIHNETTTSSAETTTAPNSSVTATQNSYILPTSNSAYLSESDIASFDKQTLILALNEIYARRGRIFMDESIANYFNSQKWYTPKYTSSEFSKNVVFNKYEQANLQLILNRQKELGYR